MSKSDTEGRTRSLEIAAKTYADCLQACGEFDSSLEFEMEPKAVRVWWTKTFEQHPDELAQRIQDYLLAAHETPSGCLVLASVELPTNENDPKRVHWREHRQKVYQLVAWGIHGALPTKRSVVRHLCNNRLCIHPDHLRVGTQAQNLYDQRLKRAGRWPHQ